MTFCNLYLAKVRVLGLDNMKHKYNHNGRMERPTINEGSFNKNLIGV